MTLPPAAAVLPVRPGGDLLLMLRDNRADLVNANRWSTIGGAVEPGETPEQAAMRETEEELGCRPPLLFSTGTVESIRFRSFLFAARVTWDLDDLIVGEGQGVDWLSPAAVRSADVVPSIRRGIERFFDSSLYRQLATGATAEPSRAAPFPPTLPALLGLRSGDLLAIRGASAGFVRRLWDVLDGVRVTASPGANERPNAMLWWRRSDEPEPTLADLQSQLAAGGAIWAIAGPHATEREIERLRAAASDCCLVEDGRLVLPGGEQASRLVRGAAPDV